MEINYLVYLETVHAPGKELFLCDFKFFVVVLCCFYVISLLTF